MRIVGGRFRGRALAAPDDETVRPTSDRVREALFNVLEHGIDDFDIRGARVLDLFAGTGALGVEALSRGAAAVTFVENRAASRALIQENIAAFGLGGIATIMRRDATDLGRATRGASFSLVFADPPYGQGLADQALTSAIAGGWLADGAIVVIEEAIASPIDWPSGCSAFDTRRYGQTQVSLARVIGADVPDPNST